MEVKGSRNKLIFFTLSYDESSDTLSHCVDWAKSFSNNFLEVIVVCTRHQVTVNPDPVIKVIELGGGSFLRRIKASLRLYQILAREIIPRRRQFTAMHHMSTHTLVLAGPILKLLGIPQGLWYSHSKTAPLLSWAIRWADYVFTPTSSSFPIPSSKVLVVGHGIKQMESGLIKSDDSTRDRAIAVIGRVTPIKEIEKLLIAMAFSKHVFTEIHCIGSVDDGMYRKSLQEIGSNSNVKISFLGPYTRDELLIRLSRYGFAFSGTRNSIDKAPLEAARLGVVVISSNIELMDASGVTSWMRFQYPQLLGFNSLQHQIEFFSHVSITAEQRIHLATLACNLNNLDSLSERLSTLLVHHGKQ